MAQHSQVNQEIIALLAKGDVRGAASRAAHCADLPVQVLNAIGRALTKEGQTNEALTFLQRAIADDPTFGPAHFNIAKILKEKGRIDEAIGHARLSATHQPQHAPSWNNLANLLVEADLPDEADQCWARALEIEPHQGTLWMNRARAAVTCGDALRAAQYAVHALPFVAKEEKIVSECVVLAASAGQSAIAERELRKLCIEHPKFSHLHLQHASTLHRLGRCHEALAVYREAARLDRKCGMAFLNAGIIQQNQVNDAVAAEKCYRKAMELLPGNPDGRLRLARLLEEKRNLDEALSLTLEARALPVASLEAIQLTTHFQGRICDWSERESNKAALFSGYVNADCTDTPPLELNFLGADPPLLLAAARGYVENIMRRVREIPPLPPRLPLRPPGRLRVGYLSQDLRNHAVGQLFHAVFAAHDRDKIEVFVYSLIQIDDEIQRSVIKGAEHFLQVGAMDPRAIAERIAADNIDVLVDLGGFTGGARTEVCALRAAPVQLLHLGYLTTTAAPWYDAVIADPTVVTDDIRAGFTERLIELPDCFAVASPLPIRAESYRRSEFGLPEDKVVLCCMSRPLKINPETFAVWMQLLRETENTVFWLFDDQLSRCRASLLAAAQSHGVDASRLHFAPQLPHPDYLASYAVADLFLDTFDYNACATAIGALHAGLPVLSCLGNTFLSRAGGSIARAVGTPSLVVDSRQEYIARALELTRSPEERMALRQLIKKRRSPLFDVAAHARALEEVFGQESSRFWGQKTSGHSG